MHDILVALISCRQMSIKRMKRTNLCVHAFIIPTRISTTILLILLLLLVYCTSII